MRVGVALVLVLVLAGCFGGGGGGDKRSSQGPGSDVDPGSDTGVIRGVMVDDAIRPLAGNATLNPGNRTVPVVDGAFSFGDVAPGSYLVAGSAAGYLTSQVTTAVLAGQASEVTVRLGKLASTEPYPLTYPFDGFVQASAGLAAALTAGVDPTGLSECQCTFEAATEPGLSRLVLEATWDDWMSDPTGATEYIWRVEALGTNATVQGTGPAPIRKVLGSLDFPAEGFQLANATGFRVSIYPDAVWPAVSQQYHAYLTLWYRGPPPDGWSIIPET